MYENTINFDGIILETSDDAIGPGVVFITKMVLFGLIYEFIAKGSKTNKKVISMFHKWKNGKIIRISILTH